MIHDSLLVINGFYCMDVCRVLMMSGEELRSYRLPSSAYVYIVRGSAQVKWDGKLTLAKRFHVLHGGIPKG
jgi:iron complex transport system substrate-binding protein